MRIDLEQDFVVTLPCQCKVTFHGGGRLHKLIGFTTGHVLAAVAEATSAEAKLAAHDAHRVVCVDTAKRWRTTKMEEIEADEPPTPEPPTPEPELPV